MLKLGLRIAATDWQGGVNRLGVTLFEIVEAAVQVGFDAISVTDHLWQHPIMGGVEKRRVEVYTMLGAISARTNRVRLLALATATTSRPAVR